MSHLSFLASVALLSVWLFLMDPVSFTNSLLNPIRYVQAIRKSRIINHEGLSDFDHFYFENVIFPRNFRISNKPSRARDWRDIN